jgi:hypothetical protein
MYSLLYTVLGLCACASTLLLKCANSSLYPEWQLHHTTTLSLALLVELILV